MHRAFEVSKKRATLKFGNVRLRLGNVTCDYSHGVEPSDTKDSVLLIHFYYYILVFNRTCRILLFVKLDNYICNGRLSLQDSDFVEIVENDIRCFLKHCFGKKVLIFPPFNNFRRFLIHKIIENQFENLKSFSIGEQEERRTVICFKKDFKDTPASSNADFLKGSDKLQSNQSSDSFDSGQESELRKKVKRVRTMPSVSIYRPPAARRLERNENLSGLQMGEIMNTPPQEKKKVRNPEESKETPKSGKRNGSNEMSVFRSAITSIRAQNKVPKCKNEESSAKRTDTEVTLSKPEDITKNAVQIKQRRPDIQVYVPKGRRSANSGNEQKPVCEKSCKEAQVVLEQKVNNNCSKPVDKSPEQSTEDKHDFSVCQPEVTSKDNEDKSLSEKCFTETQISTKSENSDLTPVKDSTSSNSNGNGKSEKLNPEECDWESMFDDSGECLDPSLMEQLTSAVGEVTIEKPKSDYNDYKNKSLDMVADEFPNVIEIYNFPPEFELHHLMTVFSQFKNSGFEIKWVDKTHALGIFSSSAIVSEVLEFYHPFVKTRSLKEGTLLSKMKARRSAESLQPYKPRPETCSALARRLVTGALGVKLPTSREEREAEKQILTKAREKRRLEAKQRENAWEGTFS